MINVETGHGKEPGSARGFWPMRDLPVVIWLALLIVAVAVHQWVPAPRWLMIHLLLLGAVGHAILVWSRYFGDTLLRVPATPRPRQNRRLGGYNLGVAVVVAGILGSWWWAVLGGAVLIVLSVLSHAGELWRQLRNALANRFAITIRFYLCAAVLLPIGVGFGVWMARDLADPLATQVRIAHVSINVLGWVGLTVLGTLITLWPTMLRTKMVPGVESMASRALPLLLVGIVAAVTGALFGVIWVVAAGLAIYLAGVLVMLVPLGRETWVKSPSAFPTWSVLSGFCWLVGCLLALVIRTALADTWLEVDQVLSSITPYLAVGFVAQLLLGASSYLLPVVRGGGPSAVRAGNRAFDTGGPLRIVVTNGGLLLCALPVPSAVRVVVSLAVLVAMASFVPLIFKAIKAARMATAPAERTHDPLDPHGARPAGQRMGLAATGAAILMVAVTLGAAYDPAAVGLRATSASNGVTPTGKTTTVNVVARGMRFHPGSITVPAGNKLVIKLENQSAGDVHDLVLANGANSGRLAPGAATTVKVGVVGRTLDGWCSVVGHKQMGMVFKVNVTGGASSAHAGHHHGTPKTPATKTDKSATLGHDAKPGKDFVARDATLGPVAPPRVHRQTLTVTEEVREVAPGVRQKVWSYNGKSPGPTLHGRVGDRFEITLINNGTMGHSIDFHAGALAPDQPMRTIGPGKSLTYNFTATRAGIWMYHCSTMPMSTHISAGMQGAVIIDPVDLPPVDRSYVLVQSEQYYGPQGGQVDVDKVNAEKPDAVVFNGYAFQYDHTPLVARVGERVRIWVLDSGPSNPTSFHVVGGQFDRVWREGAYSLGTAESPARDTGSQALDLMPAQGGFVELTFPEAGHYPFVSHIMVDAERGAHGIFKVTD